MDGVRRNAGVLSVLAAVFLLAFLPFLWVYLPKARETGMHPYRVAQAYIPTLYDMLEVGPGNLLYGRVVALADQLIRPGFPAWSEKMTGFPPMLLFLFACGVVLLFRAPAELGPRRSLLLRSFAIASLVTWALALKFHGHSLWWLVYEAFPGAKAARVVARYQTFLAAPVIAIAVPYLSASARAMAVPLLVLLCAMLLAEEINTTPLASLDHLHELARLRAVPPPPAGCKAFFVSSARPESLFGPEWDGFYSHNVDAMIIAEVLHLPTINGAATFQPPAWNLVDPDSPDYPEKVRHYAAAAHVTGLCGLDLKKMTWSPVAPSRSS